MAKREIYARVAVHLRTHDRAIEAEGDCPGAMGLYLFMLLQARGEQTAGDVSETAAMASWSAPTAYRKKQEAALLKAGLIEKRDSRLVVVRYGDHNDTPEEIAAAKGRARERMANVRRTRVVGSPNVQRTEREQHTDVPSSSSSSLSDLENRSDPPGRSPTPPDWWAGAVAAAAMAVGPVDDPAARWLEYDAARERKNWPRNHTDAVGWLCTVVRGERGRNTRRGGTSGPADAAPPSPRRDLTDYQP